MNDLSDVADAILSQKPLRARALMRGYIQNNPVIETQLPPDNGSPELYALTAALTELFARRLNQTPPAWTSTVVPLREFYYLLDNASSMPHLRLLCNTDSPEELKKFGFLAPSDYLTFA